MAGTSSLAEVFRMMSRLEFGMYSTRVVYYYTRVSSFADKIFTRYIYWIEDVVEYYLNIR